jgi:membrane carboxypeptidase/penicillin-binding protein
LEQHSGADGKRVVDERYIYIISNILSDNNARAAAFGTGSQLYIPGNKVAVKTGTSNDLKDNWTVGYTKDITIGVWVGNNDGKQMNNRLASGLTGAAPIWNRSMKLFLADHPHQEFAKPEGIKEVMVGTLSGMLPYEDKEQTRLEYFVEGTEPKTKSEIFQRVKICDDGEVKDKLYIEYKAEKEDWQPFLNSWIDEKYKDNDDERYTYRGPEEEKDDKPEKFDLDNCEEDNNDEDN